MPKYGNYKPRFYPVGDKWYPSVTTILSVLGKNALIQWAANEAVDYICKTSSVDDPNLYENARTAYKRKSEKALDIGTQFHDLAERWLKNEYMYKNTKPEDVTDDVKEMMDNFVDWCNKHSVKPIAVEQKVIGDGYAGRVDLIAEIDGIITIADIKTSKAYYDDMGLQLAAYRNAYKWGTQENPTLPIKRNLIIRVDKKSHRVNTKDFTYHKGKKWNPKTEKDEDVVITWEDDLRVFLKLKDLYWELCVKGE